MARGWESKSVESQQEALEERATKAGRAALTEDQIRRQRERDMLEMSRKRVLHDLETARNDRYRKQLEAALAHLERQLAALG